VLTVNYDNKKDCPNSPHFIRIGVWGHHNWLLQEADRTGIRFLWREAAECGDRAAMKLQANEWQSQSQEPLALVTDTKLSPQPSGSIPGPQLSRKQEISEVAEVTLIIITATQLPWEGQESPLSCLWAYCSFSPRWRWSPPPFSDHTPIEVKISPGLFIHISEFLPILS